MRELCRPYDDSPALQDMYFDVSLSYPIDVSMSMCRSKHVSDEFSFPFTFDAATVRCFTSNLIQPLLWPSVTLATLSADDD